MEKLITRNYILLCVSNFLQFIIHFLLITALPIFAIGELDGADSEVGLIIGLYMVGAVFVRPFVGRWMDAYNQKTILSLMAGSFLLPMICYAFVENITLFFVLRLVHGIAFGALTTATLTAVSTALPVKRTGEGIGYFSMCMTLGIVIGPLLALTIIESFGFFALFALCDMLALAVLLLAIAMHSCYGKKAGKIEPLRLHTLFEKRAVPIGIIAMCPTFAFSGIATFITLFAQGLGLLPYAAYYFLVSAFVILLSRPFVGRAFDRVNADILIYPSVVIMAVGLAVLAMADSGADILLSGVLIGLGNGTLYSCLQSLVIRNAPQGRTGAASSTFFIIFDIGSAVGSFLLGIVAQEAGYVVMYFVTSAVAALTGVCYFLWRRNHKNA